MDWSRAKNILIITFIGLNLFLLFYIGKSYMESGVSRETIANAEKILESKGVKLTNEIPSYLSDTGLPTYDEAGSLSIGEISEMLPENIDLENRDDVIKYVRGLLSKKGLPVAGFVTDKVFTGDNEVLHVYLVDKYKRFLIFDNIVKVHISKDRQISIEKIVYKKIIGTSASKKPIIPAYQILLKNYVVRDTNITNITAIEIGFIKHKLDESTTGVYEGPVWRVRLDTGDDAFYDGYTGQKIEQ